MLSYVPVRFDLYRAVRPALRWTLQCLVGFADHSGKCWPSVRKIAEVTGLSKSTAARHLHALAVAGIVTRKRRPGGVYVYIIDEGYLPAKVSRRSGASVPKQALIRKPVKNTDRSPVIDQNDSWQPRLRAWDRSGFWLPHWGPRPNEAGCWAPL